MTDVTALNGRFTCALAVDTAFAELSPKACACNFSKSNPSLKSTSATSWIQLKTGDSCWPTTGASCTRTQLLLTWPCKITQLVWQIRYKSHFRFSLTAGVPLFNVLVRGEPPLHCHKLYIVKKTRIFFYILSQTVCVYFRQKMPVNDQTGEIRPILFALMDHTL